MNPDEQNNNPTPNAGTAMGMDGVTPTIETTEDKAAMSGGMGMGGDTPQSDPMGAAPVDMNAPVNMGATTPDMTSADPVQQPVNSVENTPAEPTSDSLAGMGNMGSTSPADTTFTPVTAGEEVPAPEAAPAPADPTASMAATPPVNPMDASAPVNPAAAGAVAGAPAKKFALNKTTIILIAVAAVAIIGVVVVLIISNIG